MGTNTPEIAVGEALSGRRLGVLDEPGHLRDMGVGVDAGGAHDRESAGADRRPTIASLGPTSVAVG